MKIKCTFHIAIAFILIQLTDEFSIAFAYGICEKNPYVRILYVTFAILSLLTMIYLYTKYIIRIQMQDLFLGMPLPKKKWCITAVLMPVLICLFYIFFTKGTFEKGNLTYKEIIDVVTISILSSGIKAAVTEEIVFRGMILRLLQNTFGKKCAVFVSSFLFAVYHFDGIDYDEKTHRNTIFLFDHKSWDQEVDDENGNYDYLMGADLDFSNDETVQEVTSWLHWYLNLTHINGLRLDAVKHIPAYFYKDLLPKIRHDFNEEMFTVGEYWHGDVYHLENYLKAFVVLISTH